MSAARHLHPGQLAMFIPAHVLADPAKTEHSDATFYSSQESMQETKVFESKDWDPDRDVGKQSLHESIAEHGVQDPVFMGRSTAVGQYLYNGHHRVFSAADINPNIEIPVKWFS